MLQEVLIHTWLTEIFLTKCSYLFIILNEIYVIAELMKGVYFTTSVLLAYMLHWVATLLKKNTGLHQKHDYFC